MRYTFDRISPAPLLTNHLKLGGSSPAGFISVNSRYLVRDGRPWAPVMGEYHFARYRADRWPRELAKMKAGGITVVASYLFWIYHEEEEGQFDFTGQNDLRAFVLACRDAGLEVFLRIGPWAHGECIYGGFPEWIQHADFPVRCNDPRYLEKVRRWYEKVFGEISDLLYKDGGPIIGIQLDNELKRDADHLAKLKEIAREVGFDVPLYTVTGWGSAEGARIPVDEVLPCFGAYCEAPWAQHTDPPSVSPHYFFHPMRNDAAIGDCVFRPDQPVPTAPDGWRLPFDRYPFAMCELGAGLQITHHRRPVARPMDIYAVALSKLGCGNNLPGYYMFHGGTHQIRRTTMQESRASGYPNDSPILSYDFQAPLSEYGEVRESYRLLGLLHLFLSDFGADFAPTVFQPATTQASQEDAETLRCALRVTEDGTRGFVFVNHYERRRALADRKDVVFDVGSVRFPSLDVCGETCFFLPFGMPLGAETLTCATAQPLCRAGDTFFFMEIPGIRAEYVFSDGRAVTAAGGAGSAFVKNGVKIVTLRAEEARFLRRLDGELWIGGGCDLYRQDGAVRAAEDGEFDCLRWDGERFLRVKIGRPAPRIEVEFEDLPGAPFAPAFPEELAIDGERRLSWKRLTVRGEPTENALVTIEVPPERYDAAQLYADGRMIADSYDYGAPWKVPAEMLAGRECFVVFSEARDDFFREFDRVFDAGVSPEPKPGEGV